MFDTLKKTAAAALFAIAMFAAGAAMTPAVQAQSVPVAAQLGRASDRSLLQVRRRLEVLIDQLQRDNHDYGGHRVAALNLLEQARAQLDAAIDYDNRRGR